MGKRRGDTVKKRGAMLTGREKGDREKWLGGFVRYTKAGKPVFIIERHWRGGYFKASTRCNTEKAALAELAAFEQSPETYVAGGRERLLMTPELVLEYRSHQIDSGLTYEWAKDVALFLAGWLEALQGRDLRRLDVVRDINPALATWKTSLPGRIVAMKGFMTWLRKDRHLLKHHEDPMPDVRIPKRKTSRLSAPRDVPLERVMRVYRAMDRDDMKDILQLLAGTGWHVSEVMRFARNGEIRKDPTGKTIATLVVWHKAQENAITGLTKRAHLEAAKRIRERGTTPGRWRLAHLMRRSCRNSGLPQEEWFGLGDMRHSVTTWALERGEDIDLTAKFVNHTSSKMLRKHYVRHAVPRAVIKTSVLK